MRASIGTGLLQFALLVDQKPIYYYDPAEVSDWYAQVNSDPNMHLPVLPPAFNEAERERLKRLITDVDNILDPALDGFIVGTLSMGFRQRDAAGDQVRRRGDRGDLQRREEQAIACGSAAGRAHSMSPPSELGVRRRRSARPPSGHRRRASVPARRRAPPPAAGTRDCSYADAIRSSATDRLPGSAAAPLSMWHSGRVGRPKNRMRRRRKSGEPASRGSRPPVSPIGMTLHRRPCAARQRCGRRSGPAPGSGPRRGGAASPRRTARRCPVRSPRRSWRPRCPPAGSRTSVPSCCASTRCSAGRCSGSGIRSPRRVTKRSTMPCCCVTSASRAPVMSGAVTRATIS